ncbi:hypothetical protein ColTof4_14040 [Colletotrichum tofieldiae]|nr:hypothetical protein ColTof4_14040 [Colletotrichum tofieldiae]GKT97591.1 hypothetical protein Ct61P_15441 [Colletotrichum tofieldiae]
MVQNSDNAASPADHPGPPRYNVRTRLITETTSSIKKLIASHQERVTASASARRPASISRMNQSLRARQVRRFHDHPVETDKQSPVLAVLAEVDPHFDFFRQRGWQLPGDGNEERWLSSWEKGAALQHGSKAV